MTDIQILSAIMRQSKKLQTSKKYLKTELQYSNSSSKSYNQEKLFEQQYLQAQGERDHYEKELYRLYTLKQEQKEINRQNQDDDGFLIFK